MVFAAYTRVVNNILVDIHVDYTLLYVGREGEREREGGERERRSDY